MTRPGREYTMTGGTYTVRELPTGSRIVASSAGWVVRVDHPPQPEKSDRWNDRLTICTARIIYSNRSRGEALPVPWGRVVKFAGGNK